MKRYRLLKDICSPIFNIQKGMIFAKTGSAINYEDGAYTYGNDGMYPLHPNTVENNTEWFELIPEEPVNKPLPEKVKIKGVWRDKEYINSPSYRYLFYTSKENNQLSEETLEKVKQAIEKALNGEDTVVGKTWWQKLGIKFDGLTYSHPDIVGSYSNLDTVMEFLETVKPKTDTVVEDKGNDLCIRFEYKGKPYGWDMPKKEWADWIDAQINYEKRYTQQEVDAIREATWEAARLTHPLAGMKYDTFQDYLKSLHETQPKEQDTDTKPVLFTTEDGVGIKEDDMLFYVLLKHNYNLHCNPANIHDGKNPDYKYFSTKEAAEQYILEQKPCLSLNDLLDVWGGVDLSPKDTGIYKTSPLFKIFKEKAKEKLKQ